MDEQEAMNQQLGHMMARTNYMNQNPNELNSLLSELTNPEQDIYEVEMSLKGMQLNDKGEKERVTDPLLNDKGVANMIRLMRSMVSRIMYMSNLQEEDIRTLTIALGEQIVCDLVRHREEYEIKDFEDMTTIRQIITYKAFESGMAALENGFRRFLKSGIIETTVNTQGQGLKGGKGGGLGGIASLFKK